MRAPSALFLCLLTMGVKGAVPPASLRGGLWPHRVGWLSGIPKIPSVSRASRALRRSRRQRETVRAHEGGKRAENTSQNMTTGYLTHAKLQGRYPFPCASVIALCRSKFARFPLSGSQAIFSRSCAQMAFQGRFRGCAVARAAAIAVPCHSRANFAYGYLCLSSGVKAGAKFPPEPASQGSDTEADEEVKAGRRPPRSGLALTV